MNHTRVHPYNLSNITNIMPNSPPIFFRGYQHFTRDDELAIFARNPDRGIPLLINAGHNLFIDPVEHHLNHFHGRGIGDAHAAYEVRGNIQPLEQLPNLWATAMHDDGLHTHVFEEDYILSKVLLEVLVLHGVPAIFDDDGLPGKTTNKRQGFQQNISFLNEFVHMRSTRGLRDAITLRPPQSATPSVLGQ